MTILRSKVTDLNSQIPGITPGITAGNPCAARLSAIAQNAGAGLLRSTWKIGRFLPLTVAFRDRAASRASAPHLPEPAASSPARPLAPVTLPAIACRFRAAPPARPGGAFSPRRAGLPARPSSARRQAPRRVRRLSLPGHTFSQSRALRGPVPTPARSASARSATGCPRLRRARPQAPRLSSGASLQRQTGGAGPGFRRQALATPEPVRGAGPAGCACAFAGLLRLFFGKKTKKTHSAVYLVCISPVYTVCFGLNQFGLYVRLIWTGQPARPFVRFRPAPAPVSASSAWCGWLRQRERPRPRSVTVAANRCHAACKTRLSLAGRTAAGKTPPAPPHPASARQQAARQQQPPRQPSRHARKPGPQEKPAPARPSALRSKCCGLHGFQAKNRASAPAFASQRPTAGMGSPASPPPAGSCSAGLLPRPLPAPSAFVSRFPFWRFALRPARARFKTSRPLRGRGNAPV